MKLSPEAQMRANAHSWLNEAGFPVTSVLGEPAGGPDHCFLSCDTGAALYADTIMDRWDFMTRSKDHQPLGYASSVGGWRERRARWAAQLIHHRAMDGREFLELDFDASNPNWGLALAIGHGLFDWTLQKLRGTKTSPFTVAKKRGWTTEA